MGIESNGTEEGSERWERVIGVALDLVRSSAVQDGPRAKEMVRQRRGCSKAT